MTTTDAEFERREFLANIVESSQDAVIGKTLDGTVTSWNRAAEEMFGYGSDEIIGRSILVLFPPELAAEEGVILSQIRAGERIEHHETVRVRKDGGRIDVSLTVSPVRDAAGAVIGVSKIVRDVTEHNAMRRRMAEMQSELLHLSRLNDMGQLATAFAHELNQPLSAISAYIGGVRRLIESGDMARALEGCDRAGAQVVRAGEVIRRLRDFVRKGDGRRRDEDLRQIVDEAITLALLDAHSDGVEIVSAVAGNAASAFIDKVQVQQVLVNLLRNAAEAMAGTARKRLTISTRRLPGDKVEIAVADTGAGLSEEVVARLFQPFVTTKATGMGVGLSLCRSIVESMGGEISAENGSDGGAVFRFTVPAV
ncbi:MAG TPA: PAS domain S-box protein [Caulobacteraceae bacterium]|jgi:two-component system sensor kinase FixL